LAVIAICDYDFLLSQYRHIGADVPPHCVQVLLTKFASARIYPMMHSLFDLPKSGASVIFMFAAIGGLAIAAACSADAQQPKSADTPVATTTLPQVEPNVAGVWLDHTKRGAIEIMPCGARLCGYVYWIKDPVTRNGKPVLDTNNPDPTRRGKPMCGTQILVNLQQKERARFGHVWGSGSIYNPEEGQSFDAEVKLIGPNELSVLGYLGVKFMGEQFTWTRAPSDLARCGPARV
jgi:uncharacterized protein (DUF2147 family)